MKQIGTNPSGDCRFKEPVSNPVPFEHPKLYGWWLGSCNDEERSELRNSLWIANPIGLLRSSNANLHPSGYHGLIAIYKTQFWRMASFHEGDPLNLSILISGGKETKRDSPSSGEWNEKSSSWGCTSYTDAGKLGHETCITAVNRKWNLSSHWGPKAVKVCDCCIVRGMAEAKSTAVW